MKSLPEWNASIIGETDTRAAYNDVEVDIDPVPGPD